MSLESKRVAQVKKYNVLESIPQSELDDITKLTANVCGTQFAAICFLDADTIYMKSQSGMPIGDLYSGPREASFCTYAIQKNEILIVNDAGQDPTFNRHPAYVNAPNFRFYAGVPLVMASGDIIGTLCSFDTVAHELSETQLTLLKAFAKQVVALYEYHFKAAELKRMDYLFAEFQTLTNAGGWEYDVETSELSCSDGIYSIFRVKKNGLVTAPELFYMVDIEHRAKIMDLFDRAIKEGLPYNEDVKIKDLEGMTKWIRAIGNPIIDKSGKVIKLSGTLQDINKKKLVELQLRESEINHRVLFDQSSDAVLIAKPPHWNFDNVNEAALKLFGARSKESFLQYGPAKVSPEFQPDGRRSDEKAIEMVEITLNIGSHSFEWVHTKLDGTLMFCAVLLSRISHGDTVYVQATVRDITFEKTAQNDLKKMHEEYQFVLDSLGIGVWKFDIASKTQHWDNFTYQLYELTPEDFVKNPNAWEACLTPESKNLVKVDWKKILSGEKEIRSTYEIVTKSGHRKYIGSRANISYDSENTPVMLYGINWDITHDVQLEKTLQEERAKALHNSKLASIGQLAAGVGHEINNPLAIIMGQLSVAEQLLLMNEPKEVVIDRFRRVDHAVSRISNIVKGLRTFARSDDNKISEFDSYEVVTETIDMLRDIYKKDQVTLEFKGLKEGAMIYGNRGRVQQVLVNLISNAKDATDGKDNRRIIVELKYLEDQISLSVSDNGCGVPTHLKEKIFEPFFTTKDINKGTGIGLSLVNTIVKEHEGTLLMESEPNIGTKFSLLIPAKKVLVMKQEEVKTKIPYKMDCHVVVVDDEDDIRDTLKFVLSLICNKVTTFPDASRALDYLKKQPVDVVFSDVQMPSIDGFKFLDLLRENTDIPQPKFFFITGGVDLSPEKQSKVESLTNGLLSKPFKKDVIFKKLMEMFPEKVIVKNVS